MIIPMKRLSLIALKENEESIMRALQAISAVQVIKTSDTEANEPSLAKAEGNVQRLSGALSLIKRYSKKPSFLQEKPESTVEALDQQMDDALSISGAIEAVDRRRAAIRAQIDKHNAQIELLAPWEGLPTTLNAIEPTKSTGLFAGMLKAEEAARLAELSELCAVQFFGGEKQVAVLILCPAQEIEETGNLLKTLDWADVNFPKLPVCAKDAIAEDKAQIALLQKEDASLESKLFELGENRPMLAGAADAAVIARDRALARSLLEETQSAFCLEGWVRADEVEKAQSAIQSVTDEYFLDIREPAEDEVQPSVVQNSNFATPYESVTNLYSRPAPGSIDGTPFMAPWYFLLFGMMLSDSGYGLLLALGCFLFIKKAKPKGMMGDLARVIMMGGISTIVWGVLIGTCFGFSWTELFGAGVPMPFIVDPGADPITMLILCFGLGIVHIFFGVFIKIYMAFRDKDWQTAVFDNISWVLIIFGLLVFALVPAISTVGLVAALLGACMVLFMKGRGKKNIAKRLVSGAGGLYDVTSYLSDVLSYARLFALGIATGVIGSVFNQLIGMIMNASDFWLIKIILIAVGVALFVGLHIFNLGINTLGTFVHCARLQYVEFYGKFYEVGGKEFRPLGYKTRHVRVAQK